MVKDNLTAVLYGIEDLRLEQRPIPELEDDEVLLEMDSVGICGTDIHYLTTGRLGPYVVDGPMIIGHESAGVVCKLGKNVTSLKLGDRVAIEPGVPCRRCVYCKEGRYHLCDEIFTLTKPFAFVGNLSRYYKHAADFCHKLPDHVTMEEGAMLEPFAIAVHACKRAQIGLSSEIAIFGAGPIGLMTLVAAKAFGAAKIFIADLNEERLKTAKSLGADFTLKIEKGANEADLLKKIHAMMGRAPDRTFDCCGAELTNRLAILGTRAGGAVVLVGSGPLNVNVPLVNASNREVDILAAFRCVNDYPLALHLVASGKVDIKPLCTHHFDITKTLDAFETSRYALDGAVKVMIHVQPRDKNNPVPFTYKK